MLLWLLTADVAVAEVSTTAPAFGATVGPPGGLIIAVGSVVLLPAGARKGVAAWDAVDPLLTVGETPAAPAGSVSVARAASSTFGALKALGSVGGNVVDEDEPGAPEFGVDDKASSSPAIVAAVPSGG